MFQKCISGIRNQFPIPFFNYVGFCTCLGFCRFHQHVRHAMQKKSKRYLPPDNEYCRVNMEEAQINSNLRNGNRELVPCSLFE